ncbi:hypothetical protein V1507DRAFT_440963 [Lipomyces tetrasporus]
MVSNEKHPGMYFGVLVVPNPNKNNAGDDFEVATVPESLSFRLNYYSGQIFYEASKDNGLDLSALLYVPTIDHTDDCGNSLLPNNVTHISQLPLRYNLVALAPLTSPSCARIWMDRAHHDGAQDVIFYGPNDDGSGGLSDNSSAIPTADWIENTDGLTYSIYYVPNSIGGELVDYLSAYSGNMTGVPNGSELVKYFDFRDYVRVAVEIDNPDSNKVPGLWVFLVIALAVLLLAAVSTSVGVHLLQYRNRRRLRRRIENGEIDLEALGIKRLTVPRWILDKLPVRVYVPGDARYVRRSTDQAEDPSTKREVDNRQLQHPTPTTTTTLNLSSEGPPAPSSTPLSISEFSQTTCPICLEDYIPDITLVRELPCLHIYHLECIDGFLEHQSSLCPLCKQSALPRGYIPSTLRITNATVRRERRMRRDRFGEEHGLTSFSRFTRPWRRRSHRDGDDQNDEYELQDIAFRQGVTVVRTDTNAPHATSGAEQPVNAVADITDDHHTYSQTGRRDGRENEIRLAASAQGAAVATDGTVFMVEDQHEDSRLRRSEGGKNITAGEGTLASKRTRTEAITDSTNSTPRSSSRKPPVVNYYVKEPPSSLKSTTSTSMSRNKEPVESDIDDDDEDTYTVEAIKGHNFNKKGELLFYIKWLGYDKPEDDSWEPESNLVGAREMVEEYLEKIGGRPEPPANVKRKRGAPTGPRRQKAQKIEETKDASSEANGARDDEVADLPLGSWETKIKEIKSISKTDQGKLLFTIEWVNGQKDAAVEAQVLYSKAPQKALQFYESHIQFS